MAVVSGEKFDAQFVKVTQERLDNELVRSELTPEQLKKCLKVITFQQLKCGRIGGKKKDFKMPNLSNATPEGLVDMLGQLREEKKDLEKLEGIYKAALEARMGVTTGAK